MGTKELKGLIIFDHDGTLVNTDSRVFEAFEGTHALLASLRQHGFEIALWTARGHRSSVESLKFVGLSQYIGEIYGHDDGLPKPHVAGLLQITDGFTKDKIIHIGDSIGDLTGAQNFGIPVIGALWSCPETQKESTEETFRKYTKFIAHKVIDCKKIIEDHFKITLD